MNIGLIFDMDGVIVNNNHYHFRAWQVVYERHGKHLDAIHYRDRMNGRTLNEIVAHVLDDSLTPEKIREIGLEKERVYRELYQPYISPTTGLLKLLSDANKLNIPMVIGTSAPSENVKYIMNGTGIRHYFTDILDESAVTRGKPDPEIYQKCAAAIGLPNNRCVVFEDAVLGIQAGKASGSKVIGVATSHDRSDLDADMIVDDFKSISIEQIAQLIG